MKPNSQFLNRNPQFWGYVRIISEQVGYSDRRTKTLKRVSYELALEKLTKLNIIVQPQILTDVIAYLEYRTNVLNNVVQYNLMNVDEARVLFNQYKKIYIQNNLTCALPLNKQKEEKKDIAYFTGIINILTELYLRRYANTQMLEYGKDIYFDDDPKSLTYVKNDKNEIVGAFSRRFDGAFPSTIHPKAIWEIKEYYYTTTFGSRVADGVFETQLDGYEIRELSEELKEDVKHIYFIDAYGTWWEKGKSYLCRIVDMLHMGLVDEVIFGKEVIERWPKVLNEII